MGSYGYFSVNPFCALKANPHMILSITSGFLIFDSKESAANEISILPETIVSSSDMVSTSIEPPAPDASPAPPSSLPRLLRAPE